VINFCQCFVFEQASNDREKTELRKRWAWWEREKTDFLPGMQNTQRRK
jgi:hypothetical protein